MNIRRIPKVDEEEKALNSESCKENIVSGFWVFILRLSAANEPCSSNLHHHADSVSRYEGPEYELPAGDSAMQWYSSIFSPRDKLGKTDVNTCRDEYGSDGDKKVGDDKIDDVIRIIA